MSNSKFSKLDAQKIRFYDFLHNWIGVRIFSGYIGKGLAQIKLAVTTKVVVISKNQKSSLNN